ncbi:MAG: hypothetical protein HKP01_05230 [Gemmatimonadetes bacterium]|nr:hypothetical protein [Gemmatimonadota bacterium]
MLTRTLLIAIALLLAAGAWRMARWYWRPRLVLPDALVLERAADGIRVSLEVRNEGAGRSRNCRAVLIRCERQEPIGWLRIEPPPRTDPADPNAPGTGILPHSSARIDLDRVLPDEPGTYRLEIAVLNGEEKRSSYIIDVPAAWFG